MTRVIVVSADGEALDVPVDDGLEVVLAPAAADVGELTAALEDAAVSGCVEETAAAEVVSAAEVACGVVVAAA